MKNIRLAVLTALLLAMALPVGVQADEASDHQAFVASYEQKAAEQDALIAEHVQMKKDYADRFVGPQKTGTPAQVKEMEQHCDAIIQDATKLRDEFLEFAKWHKMRAAELQGR
jgi:hypothetical protein